MQLPAKSNSTVQLNGSPLNSRLVFQRALSSQASLAYLVIVACLGFFQIFPNILLVSTLGIISFKEFYQKIDRGLPLLELTNLIAVLQWTIGPAISFFFGLDHYKYHMYVDEATFFSFALPATCCFTATILGWGLVVDQRLFIAEKGREFYFLYGVYLVTIAFVAESVSGRAPASVQFFFYLLSQLRYVAAMYFLLSGHRFRFVATLVACSSLFVKSSSAGMFHDLLLWLALIFCVWYPSAKWLHYRKPYVFLVAGLLIFTIQVVKQDYRERLRVGDRPSIFLMAFDYLSPAGKAWDEDILSLALVRLNQGWIISAVMKHVPAVEPFANGQTVVDSVIALAPRFIIADKAGAGGREGFRRFTGLPIGDHTSMSVCVLGEAYANFGEFGGILFMAAFGGFIAVYYTQILKWTYKHPDFLLWIPLIFYQAIKAETDLVVIVNQIVKGSIVAFGCYWALHRYFPPETFRPLSYLPRNYSQTRE